MQGGLCPEKTSARAKFNGGVVQELNIKINEDELR
jgi:hypothetical protein